MITPKRIAPPLSHAASPLCDRRLVAQPAALLTAVFTALITAVFTVLPSGAQILTIAFLVVQFTASIYYMFSYVPHGQAVLRQCAAKCSACCCK